MTNRSDFRDEWEVVEDLGSGGQGTTKRVKSKTDESKVGVLKQLKNNKSPQARRRMFQEVTNLRIVADAGGHVPHVLDDNVAQFEDSPVKLYFVMEWVEGCTLDEYVRQSKGLSVDAAVNIVLDVCRTVQIAHEQNVLHRDLKPKNVIVIPNEPVRTNILDYGLSFNRSGVGDDITRTDEHFRNEFLSLPEANVVGGDRRDLRSDYSAICGLLYFCLTGHYPELLRDSEDIPPHRREGRSIHEALGQHPMLSHFNAFFQTGFEANIAHRFQTLNDITSRLHAILISAAVVPPEDPMIVATRASERLRQTNRPIQLGEFGKAITPVLNAVTMYAIVNLQGKLGLFQVQPLNIGKPSQPQLPQGVEDVGSVVSFRVRVEHGTREDVIFYKVGAVENDAVVLQTTISMSHFQGGMMSPNRRPSEVQWREVFRYPGDSPPEGQLLIEDFKRSLNELMDSFDAT